MLPWLLALGCCLPIIWLTFQWFFPDFWAELSEQRLGLWLEFLADYWLHTWITLKLMLFLLISIGYVIAARQLLGLLLP